MAICTWPLHAVLMHWHMVSVIAPRRLVTILWTFFIALSMLAVHVNFAPPAPDSPTAAVHKPASTARILLIGYSFFLGSAFVGFGKAARR
eukprot:6445809-Prymnesium_polylepis.1